MAYPKAVYNDKLVTMLVRDEIEEAYAESKGFGLHPSERKAAPAPDPPANNPPAKEEAPAPPIVIEVVEPEAVEAPPTEQRPGTFKKKG